MLVVETRASETPDGAAEFSRVRVEEPTVLLMEGGLDAARDVGLDGGLLEPGTGGCL
jgi:hypothetical protein